MNNSRPFTWIAAAIFAIMAIAHIYRIVSPFDVNVGSVSLPMWVSYVAAVVTALLSWMLCREARGTTGP
jgi:hypothetical protein